MYHGTGFTRNSGSWPRLSPLLTPFGPSVLAKQKFIKNFERVPGTLRTRAGHITDGSSVQTHVANTPMSVDTVGDHTMLETAHLPVRNTQHSPDQCHPLSPQIQETTSSLTENKPVTPILTETLKTFLTGYNDSYYLLQGFTQGFHLGYSGPRAPSSAPNLKSCQEHPDIVQTKLSIELAAHRIVGPFDSPPFSTLRISPIGLVPKKGHNQFRLIHHLSYPQGMSVNDSIDPQFSSVQYATFDDAVHELLQLGKGSLLAKTDIDNAFRLIPIHPDDHDLLGMTFRGQFYYDTCLPMGASSSCAIFERFSTALHWIASNKLSIKHMVHILDDFLILGPPNSITCQRNLEAFIALCSEIGVPIKSEKTQNACQVITFLGLELDSTTMEARLPYDKLVKLRTQLAKFSKHRKITLKELQSLLGLLNFCCTVVPPGRPFLRRLTDLTKKVTRPSHRITLNKESRKDLLAWQFFADHFNGTNLLLQERWVNDTALHLYTDASGSIGFGAVFQTHWFYGTWTSAQAPLNITFKELLPIVLALELWGSTLANKCLTLHSDNYAVVHIINKQTCKDPLIMLLVRRLVLTCLKHNILVRSTHISGKSNVLPDLLSRLQIRQFQLIAPHMDEKPTTIPDSFLRLP